VVQATFASENSTYVRRHTGCFAANALHQYVLYAVRHVVFTAPPTLFTLVSVVATSCAL